jgi:predicted dehydrogenase
MIRIATIGTNFIVDWFLEALAHCPGFEHKAVYSRKMETGEAFAKKYGITKVYDHIEELAMDPEIDAVYIASPPSCHFSQAMMMINYGKHVLCEKPAVSNTKELEMILQAAKENQVIYLEAMKNVYTPGFFLLQEILPMIGTVRRATLQRCKLSSSYGHYKEGIIDNVFQKKLSNGALMDIGCYGVHFMVKLFGMPQQIQADGILLSNGIDGAGTVLAHYDGMQAEILYSKMTNTKVDSQIQGEEGCILIPDISHPRELRIEYYNGNKENFIVPQIKGEQGRNNLIYEIIEFQKLIGHKKVEHEHWKYSLMNMRVLDEARNQMGIYFPADKIMEV